MGRPRLRENRDREGHPRDAARPVVGGDGDCLAGSREGQSEQRNGWESRKPTVRTKISSPTRTIDAIYNPLPNHLHVPWSVKAAEHNKHVLCEKPVALTADEARQLLDVRNRTGVKIQEAFMIRTHPQWLAVKDLVSSGRIGELRSMLGAFSYTNRDPANIRNRPDFGGGALMDIGCYLVNTSRFIFGREPLRVTGAIERDPDMRTDRLTSILLDFGTGHAAGTCSTQMVPYQHAADSVARRAASSCRFPSTPHPTGPTASSSTPVPISLAVAGRASKLTPATSTRSRAIFSRRPFSTAATCPVRSKTP